MASRKKLQLLSLALIANECGLLIPKIKRKRIRRWGVRPLNQLRRKNGRFLNTFNTMRNKDPEEFYKYTRMYVDEFDFIVSLLETRLDKRSCINTVTVKERLAITLSYLAQGSAMCEVARAYLRGRGSVSVIIREMCQVLWDTLSPRYLSPPTVEQWEQIKLLFYERWNMPNCVGAIDGKHIAIQSPFRSGTTFYNYKHFYSIHLMAICDADYRFVFVDIGAQGICGDSGVFKNSNFGSAIINETLIIPRSAVLPKTDTEFPCFFVADEAFPLRRNIMRPYPQKNASMRQRIFNYRLSRARRIIENTFGILVSRWRILRRPIIGHPKTVDGIVKATIALHNFLRSFTPGQCRSESSALENIVSQGSRNYSQEVMHLRETLCEYFVSDNGSVYWQNDKI